MTSMTMNIISCLLNVFLLSTLVKGSAVTRGQGGKSVLCYIEGVSINRPHEEARFAPEDLDVEICTHLMYNRAVVDEHLEVVPKDRAVDLLEDGGKGLYNRTLKLKEMKPGLKVFIDVYDKNGEFKNQAAGNRSAIERFARNAADFVRRHGFDGMNIRTRGSEGFEEVTTVIHEEFVRHGFVLMTILPSTDFPVDLRVEMTEPLSRNFDLLVVSSYWKLPTVLTEITSSLAELERAVEEITAVGIPAGKLVAAIPAFCLSVKLCDRENSAIGAPICCGGSEGVHEELEMILHNGELMRKMANTSESWVIVRDPEARVPYAHSKSLQWTSFEDPESVRAKARFILESNLAGAAIMNVDMEDFKGSYTAEGETFPLTRAAYNALNGEP